MSNLPMQSQIIKRQTESLTAQRAMLIRAAALIHLAYCSCWNAEFGEFTSETPCERCRWLDDLAPWGIDPRKGIGMDLPEAS